jgi:hypothetical protein
MSRSGHVFRQPDNNAVPRRGIALILDGVEDTSLVPPCLSSSCRLSVLLIDEAIAVAREQPLCVDRLPQQSRLRG